MNPYRQELEYGNSKFKMQHSTCKRYPPYARTRLNLAATFTLKVANNLVFAFCILN
jgi:hypothetical protein